MGKIIRYPLLLIISLTVIISSCKKKEILYSFDGVVTNSVDGSKINSAKVTLSQKKVKNGGTAKDYSEVISENTGSDGRYGFTIGREMVTSFLFEFEKDNYFEIERIETSANVTTDGTNTINAVMEPQSWIKIEIKNLYPNDSDYFKFITHNFREGCEGCAENKTVNFYGSLDTVLNYVTTGGKYVRFTYINVFTGFSRADSIYAAPFETQFYPITY